MRQKKQVAVLEKSYDRVIEMTIIQEKTLNTAEILLPYLSENYVS